MKVGIVGLPRVGKTTVFNLLTRGDVDTCSGSAGGQRHPVVGSGVMFGAGAKVLGPVMIGDGSKIGAGSIVLDDVPAHVTAAGVPARIVGRPRAAQPALEMDQSFGETVDTGPPG